MNSANLKNSTQKVVAQELIQSLGLNISFFNIFNKGNNSKRKNPNTSLVCYAESITERNEAYQFMTEKGFSCKKGPKTIPVLENPEQKEYWKLVIDL